MGRLHNGPDGTAAVAAVLLLLAQHIEGNDQGHDKVEEHLEDGQSDVEGLEIFFHIISS